MAAKGLVIPRQEGPLPFNAVRWFARHFAHLQCECVVRGESGGPQPFGISGFVVEMDGEWFLITAGHCLEEVKKLGSKGCTFRHWHLDDAMGAGARYSDTGPFAFDAALKGGLYDGALGIDYGLIHLRNMYRLLMEANGIVPLNRDAWPTRRRQFERFWLLGVPHTTIEVGSHPSMIQKGVRLMGLETVEVGDIPVEMKKLFSRHFFKIISGLDDMDPPVDDIGGMSGGPIFAMRDVQGEKRYWLVGVQSTWRRDIRVTAACPVDGRFAQVLRRSVRLILQSKLP